MVGLENCLHMGQVADFVWIFLKGCGFLSSNVRVCFFRTNALQCLVSMWSGKCPTVKAE